MKELSTSTKLYLYATFAAGIAIFGWYMGRIDPNNLLMLMILCSLAALALIVKVEGSTNRSHYTLSFLIYGFTFTLLGVPEAILVIFVSNLAEWIWNRSAWYIQLFNASCYILLMHIAGLIYSWISPSSSLVSWQAVLAIALSMGAFNALNHLMVGLVVWFARGENFKKSGVFEFFPLILDLTLLYFGASLSFVWTYNNFALILFLVPIYMIYGTLRVPALERKTEIDTKTGLFNHEYFKQQVSSELSRANRFDRPLTIIIADLDLLRNINNTYGHLAGDEVLIGVAKILRQSVREYDVAARFGGEEFAIMLPETTIEQAFERTERIRKAIEEAEFTIPTNAAPIRVTMSFGIACRENFRQTMDEIIHNADMALYRSKLTGRNRAYAYSHEEYINSLLPQDEERASKDVKIETPGGSGHSDEVNSNPDGASLGSMRDPSLKAPEDRSNADQASTLVSPCGPKHIVNLYIGVITLIAFIAFAVMNQHNFPVGHLVSSSESLSLLVVSLLIVASEWLSINLYFKQTAISTSAIPILAGYLLFGSIGVLIVSLVAALTLFVKYRSPISRLFFNFSNHVLAGTLCISLIFVTRQVYLGWSPLGQMLLSVASAVLMYLTTTWLIAIGMSLDLQQPALQIWKEQYSWVAPYYLGFGFITYTLIFGYQHGGNWGILLIITPMVLLRFSQKQYISRTKEAVIELREKNRILKKSTEEIIELNEGLLEMLSEIISLRDPYVLGHSKQVSYYASEIAKILGLEDKHIELIRKGALLHDIGKLGIPENILRKPVGLNGEEYEVIKGHSVIGAELAGKSPSLRSVIPIIRHHHEFFNGKGYPDKLSGNQIPIEARIVAVADTIGAMASDRPYRKALDLNSIRNEIKNFAGTQFDPLVVDAALKVIESDPELRRSESDIQPDLLRNLAAIVPSS